MARDGDSQGALYLFGYPFRIMRGHPRLFISFAAAALAYVAIPAAAGLVTPTPWAFATRLLIGWNAGALLYFALAGMLVVTSDCDSMRRRAKASDEGRVVTLILTCAAAAVSMAAIVGELGVSQDMAGLAKALHVTLAAATIVTAWTFIHLTFALHYAHEYFDEIDDEEAGVRKPGDAPHDKPELAGGLKFPGTDVPDYLDFLYFSFIIGVASQTADVSIASKEMRRVSLAHSIIAFFFNSAVLALTINIAAGLI
ncbi:DUF1345 domain-containing protein [Methylocella sp.]|uniref:DUF1345 domain-containing protein n=1 Tax=Methylocella sp. TaxID=1978226 RepID=UPI0037832137